MSIGRRLRRAAAIALGTAAIVWLAVVAVRDGWGEADAVASVFGGAAGIVALTVSLVVQSSSQQESTVLQPRTSELDDWVLPRGELEETVAAVCRQDQGSAVALTTALKGAGGFGKTTLARLACTHPEVQKRFKTHVYFVTIGRDIRGRAAIAAKVADVTRTITGESLEVSQDSDPIQLGIHLGNLLARRPRTLLVIDDVWEAEQLSPFLQGAEKRCVRLVTTRNPDALPAHARQITVDRMSPRQAREVLSYGLDNTLTPSVIEGLIRATGRWPLLLRMVNQFIVALTATGITGTEAASHIYHRLQTLGPAGADGDAPLDLNDPKRRNEAVRASIQAATTLLPEDSDDRFAELGIFAEDEQIPMRLVTLLWRATNGLDEAKSRHLCKQMADLSLLSISTETNGGSIVLHDVIRDYLRIELGERLAVVNSAFLDTLSVEMPTCTAMGHRSAPDRQWWNADDHYLMDHLITHFIEAGRRDEAEGLAGDLRWVRERLHQRGTTAPARDLDLVGTPESRALAADLVRAAHLLPPTEPLHSWDAVLRSRLHPLPHWGEQTSMLAITPPALVDLWPPPDIPHPALRRTLSSHTAPVTSVAISPGGTWIATASSDRTLRIWNAETGIERLVVDTTATVTSVAISPDGTWIAAADTDGTVHIVDAVTGLVRITMAGHTGALRSVVISPDGTWIAAAGRDTVIRIWDVVTGQERRILIGHTESISSISISSDGSWLATSSDDKTVRIWDAETGREISVLAHANSVIDVSVSHQGTWLVTACTDATVLVWDRITSQVIHTFSGFLDMARSVAISPDGTWIATTHGNGAVRIWDTATQAEKGTLIGHGEVAMEAAISADSTWLATASHDYTVRIWDVAAAHGHQTVGHSDRVWSMGISPDGTWIATASTDETARIWNSTTGQEIHRLTAHASPVWSVAISPDGTWIATSGSDNTTRIWNAATGREIRSLIGHTETVWSVAISPDGAWLATASEDGTIRIWDVTNGSLRYTISVGMESVGPLTMHPRGEWLASCSEATVHLWDAATGRALRTLTGHTRLVVGAVSSPDGTWIATASYDETARIWDAATGREIHTLTGHTDAVSSVAISPDGTWIATASYDKTARIWDAATGQGIHTLTGHTDALSSVAISPDGTRLATVGHDKTVRVWDVASGSPIAMTRAEGGMHISLWSSDQRSLFVGGQAGLYGYEFRTNEQG
ncbi:NB-ARC domain-containing protein [Streptomyces sp. CB02009]|uniref:NB-ARC domain-containing protein n=1 Tax=Streptomyces sp. CB02009 TaxID=1703938 RepID=UPI0009395F75|nr:NB-ARC domain-containing protein [Streptomyces sp. CB02009]